MDSAERSGRRVFDLEHLFASWLRSAGIDSRFFHCLQWIAWDAHLLMRAPFFARRLGDFRWINRAKDRPWRRFFPFTIIRFRGFTRDRGSKCQKMQVRSEMKHKSNACKQKTWFDGEIDILMSSSGGLFSKSDYMLARPVIMNRFSSKFEFAPVLLWPFCPLVPFAMT